MRKIPVGALKPGLKTGRPVYNGNGQVLLNSGVILTPRFIHRLKLLGIPAVYVDDGFLPDIEISDVISEETRVRAVAKVKALLAEQSEQRSLVGRAIISVKEMYATVYEIIDELMSNHSLMVNMIDIRCLDEYTFGHSVNVCVLAVLTGITMGFGRNKLFHLGMSALLHDIGKTKIPLELLNKDGPLTRPEFETIKKHCFYGAEILAGDPYAGPLCRLVALQHHERYNGTGYPGGLAGGEIHLFARITGLADTYDAMTADRVYRRAYPPHEAYEMIAGSGDYLFDFEIVQSFLYNVAAYPLGSLLRLSNGETGVVVETMRGFSLYPRVRILFAADGAPLTSPYEVWLGENRQLAVTEVIRDYWELGSGKQDSSRSE
ncbi:HD-GYP domain-containing protein [Desulfotomaculum copahuensis]|uniref:Phosphodiesterase n=1 Tax=Desulfotomaculum copahuensis TaxID=1838280 RepID=A0A1B7LGX6_9FIRM|nr:HD domain-containing phosphohydrolase [Desulfotomaculum copahuensis]OAT85455.1 phosphodiesterase [Desulfotomaculum copahuensis]